MEHNEVLTPGSVVLRLSIVFLLVFANGFFVAAEFALVGARRSRIDAMVARGDSRARTVRYALTHLDRYISGTQLGITLASLALGWLGEPALAAMIDRLFGALGVDITRGAAHTGAAITIAFLTITFLHIVLGELAPKSLALVAPEEVSRWVARPLILFSRFMAPFIWLLNGAANLLLRPFGIRHDLRGRARAHGGGASAAPRPGARARYHRRDRQRHARRRLRLPSEAGPRRHAAAHRGGRAAGRRDRGRGLGAHLSGAVFALPGV